MQNIGDAPPDLQLHAAQMVMNRLQWSDVVKVFAVYIKQDSPSHPRIIIVQWSKLLHFPFKSFAVLASSLTKANYEVMEVMET